MQNSIIAIDPGTFESAVLAWDGAKIEMAAIIPNQEVTSDFSEAAAFGYKLVIEGISSYGMPVGKEVFETCMWIGEFRRAWFEVALERPSLIYRRDVKLHHCGSARAKDGNVIQALKDKYGEKGTKKSPGVTYKLKSHLWQAFAIATMVTEQARETTIEN